MNHEELADIVHGDEADQRTLLEDRNRVAIPPLEACEHRLQHLGGLRRLALAHAVGDERRSPALRQRLDEVASCQHARDPPVDDYRKVLL